MAPDGTPGGGLPREDYAVPRSDITPQVLEAVRAMNATEDKNGCLHDDGNGQFVSKGDTGFNRPDGDGSSGTRIRVIVKLATDISNERKKMFTWYRNNLQGKTVIHPK